MFYNIKAKLITLYSLVMIAFTSLLLCIIYINEKDQLLDLELEKSTEVSQMHAKLLSQEFDQYVTMLQMVNDDSQVKFNDKAGITRLLKRLLKVGNGSFINAIYVDESFNLTDASGKTGKVTHPLFMHGELWDNKEYTITDPIYTSFEQEPVIVVAVPILDELKEWNGTLAVAVPLTLLSNKLSSIKLAKESYAWLVDSDGLVVSHPNEKTVMNTRLTTSENPNFPGFYKIFIQTKIQKNGYGHYRDVKIEEDKIVTFSKIETLPGWTLFVTTEETEIFRNINQIFANIIIISTALMLVFLILISQLANRIAKPISRLTKDVNAAVNSKQKDFNIVDSNDEIGDLSRAFHRTFKKINSYTTRLEEMVSQRTQEITSKNALLSEKNTQLETLVSIDSLTGLYNRRAFQTLVDKELSRAKRHVLPVTLAIIDIDHFKSINDTYGHTVGDDVLRQIAEELTANMRNEDVICRWGGEEFVILMIKTTTDLCFEHLDRVRDKISKLDFGPVKKVTFSTGLATLTENEEFKDWLHRADEALYKAKDTGRNRIVKAQANSKSIAV